MKLHMLMGASLVLAALGSSAAIAGDPFEDARYYVGTLDDAKVLAMVDSGEVSVTDTNPEGYTLLHYAADGNRLELVKALLQRGANPDAKANTGSTPWDMATSSSVKAVLKAAMKGAPAHPSFSAPSTRASTATTSSRSSSTAVKTTASSDKNRADCNKKWKADYDLCSDTTCKMITYRKHSKCLQTGQYW
jgi:hypothetical protein